MIDLFGFQISHLELFLTVGLLMSALMILMTLKRINGLQRQLHASQLTMAREIKMVNQGAIGVGRRFAEIEKKLKKGSNVASFAPAQELKTRKQRFAQVQEDVVQASKSVSAKPSVASRALSTKAEQALSAWLNEQKTA